MTDHLESCVGILRGHSESTNVQTDIIYLVSVAISVDLSGC